MEQGSLPERYLSRSVIKHIRRLNPKLSVSAAVGNDYANLHGSVSADGIGNTPVSYTHLTLPTIRLV